jgi:hypothetical protein
MCDITDKGVESLCGLANLKILNVAQTRCTMDVPSIARLEHLEEVWAAETPLSPNGMLALGQCRRLRTLSIANCRVTSEMLCALEGHPTLEYLDVSGSEVSQQGLECVSRIRGLTVLILDGCSVSVGDLSALRGLSNLYMLSLKNVANATEKSADLRRHMPHVKVILE